LTLEWKVPPQSSGSKKGVPSSRRGTNKMDNSLFVAGREISVPLTKQPTFR